ncbi:MAG: 50S ribosomal protein L23 [Candidatus Altiarchaeales archaeon HGW-Altiarchaeales-3]|nr:MAG: 50S ribosomal protein L23 [Candidatus Altiarchaeales archaeon HGW-Altiarchaeales-3]
MLDPKQNPYEILLYPIMGEKATILKEKENKLTFAVAKSANKNAVKDAVEKLYNVKVLKINLINTVRGKKRVHVKLEPEYSAEDVISRFGVV